LHIAPDDQSIFDHLWLSRHIGTAAESSLNIRAQRSTALKMLAVRTNQTGLVICLDRYIRGCRGR
jgi:hypothetical protein